MDRFIKLPVGGYIPAEVTKLTGITENFLDNNGIEENMAYKMFQSMLNGRVLLCAYNAQFDASFLATRMPGFNTAGYDWLDLLTVYKDRAAYPHKLSDAIEHYKLGKKVQNTHRAIDDVMALYEVMKAMMRERSDIAQYINIFGYNPKYGVEGSKLPGIEYKPQAFTERIGSKAPCFSYGDTLPKSTGVIRVCTI